MELTTEDVKEIFKDCSYNFDTWEPEHMVPIQSIRGACLMDQRKIDLNKDKIIQIRMSLYPFSEELSIPFRNLRGGFCEYELVEHLDIERACVLLIAAGFGDWSPLHKKEWPASLPNFIFNSDGFSNG